LKKIGGGGKKGIAVFLLKREAKMRGGGNKRKTGIPTRNDWGRKKKGVSTILWYEKRIAPKKEGEEGNFVKRGDVIA